LLVLINLTKIFQFAPLPKAHLNTHAIKRLEVIFQPIGAKKRCKITNFFPNSQTFSHFPIIFNVKANMLYSN